MEKGGLKFNIQKTKLMASGPTISWQTDREKMETVQDFIFLGSKITVDGDWSHEIKTLALGKCQFLVDNSENFKRIRKYREDKNRAE